MTLLPSTYLPRFSSPADIDEFVSTLERFEKGEMSAEDFRRYRLTRGVYGQRQTDVQMLRVKIPQGVLAPAALEALADVAERFGHGHGSVTTRQNVQFHFVQMRDVETAMRRLDEAGLTTREACGNTVRTVTADPLAGVRNHGTFDVTPYGEAITRFFLRSPWANSLPRKFKVALGYEPGDTAMAGIHDIGLIARVRDGKRGFLMRVAGGLSTSPQAAIVFDEFLPEERLLDACEAVNRVFDRNGNRENKHRARLKYVLRKMGQEKFLTVLREEYAAVIARGGTPLDLSVTTAPPVPPPPATTDDAPATRGPGYLLWRGGNTVAQDQPGYHAVILRLALGAVTTEQFRALAKLVTEFGDGSLRTTVDQNLVLRFIPTHRLPALHARLDAIGLAKPGARTVADLTTCPGAESCNLAVTASRQVGAAITERLESDVAIAAAVKDAADTVIKISGCPNSCGQHHIADIGWHGAARKVGERTAPVYQLHLGGGFDERGARFGRQIVKIPARRVAEAVARLVSLYSAEKAEGETPTVFYTRVTSQRIHEVLDDLAALDAATPDETFLDIGEEAGFKIAIGEGECAA